MIYHLGNKHVYKADLQEEEIISASKSSQDLDITKNGWADLDAFKLSRQELYQNGISTFHHYKNKCQFCHLKMIAN